MLASEQCLLMPAIHGDRAHGIHETSPDTGQADAFSESKIFTLNKRPINAICGTSLFKNDVKEQQNIVHEEEPLLELSYLQSENRFPMRGMSDYQKSPSIPAL